MADTTFVFYSIIVMVVILVLVILRWSWSVEKLKLVDADEEIKVFSANFQPYISNQRIKNMISY